MLVVAVVVVTVVVVVDVDATISTASFKSSNLSRSASELDVVRAMILVPPPRNRGRCSRADASSIARRSSLCAVSMADETVRRFMARSARCRDDDIVVDGEVVDGGNACALTRDDGGGDGGASLTDCERESPPLPRLRDVIDELLLLDDGERGRVDGSISGASWSCASSLMASDSAAMAAIQSRRCASSLAHSVKVVPLLSRATNKQTNERTMMCERTNSSQGLVTGRAA